jgi:hypothetical protein
VRNAVMTSSPILPSSYLGIVTVITFMALCKTSAQESRTRVVHLKNGISGWLAGFYTKTDRELSDLVRFLCTRSYGCRGQSR